MFTADGKREVRKQPILERPAAGASSQEEASIDHFDPE
jgi:hypothetical protein